MTALDQAYARCPVWLQTCGITLFGLAWKRRRFGSIFRKSVPDFVAREAFTPEQWLRYQEAELRRILVWSFDRVPYYRREWARVGFTRKRLEGFEVGQLNELPTVGKQDLRRAPADFIAKRRWQPWLHTYHTSGSTGTPLAVRMSSATHQTWSAAYEARCRLWAGVNHHMSRAMIGGRLVVPRANGAPPFWRYNPVERQLYLSAFHIAPGNVLDYVQALNTYRPDYLVGYASAHFFLARFIEEAALQVHAPRAVLTSSEKLTDTMRETLSRVYRCDVFDAYSGVEPCCLISECERHRLHVSPDVGIIELVASDGRVVGPGEEGEVVATGLINFDQPLVRYRLGDLVSWDDQPCPCGRSMAVVRQLSGRVEDAIVGPDGRETVRFHGLYVGIASIQEAQVVQETLQTYTVRIVAPKGLSRSDRDLVVGRMRQRLGDVMVAVAEVPFIERTDRGKFQAVVSKVSRQPQGRNDVSART